MIDKPRTLFLQHEQRRFYWNEPGHLELYKPMITSGLLGEVRTYPFQRDIRWLEREHGVYNHRLEQANLNGTAAPEKPIWTKENSFEQMLDAVICEFKPDLVVYALTWPNQAIPVDILRCLRARYNFKLFSIIWDYDENNSSLMDYDKNIIEASDLVSVADSYWRLERIKNRKGVYKDFVNVDVAHFMPTIPDPSIFYPRKEKLYDVSIAGSSEGQRIDIYNALTARNIPVRRIGGLMSDDNYLSDEDYAKEISESRIVINTQTQPERIQLKGRVCQVLSCGSFLLEQKNRESDRFLTGMGVETWETIDDLIGAIGYWLNNEHERERKARESHFKYIECYNPKSWTKNIIDAL